MLAQLGEDRAAWHRTCGVYHLTSAGEATWHDFASAIVDQRQHETLPCQRGAAITTADYPTPARRPAYSVLDCDKLAGNFGIRLPDWRDVLGQVQEDLDSQPTP